MIARMRAMDLVYIFDKERRLELWGIYKKGYANGSNDTNITIEHELRISHKYPAGFIVSEFISLDEMELIKMAQSLDAADDPCFSPCRMIEPLSRVLFCEDDTTTILSDLHTELLYIANSISIFRKFVDLCNENRALFTDVWLNAFWQAADIYGDYSPKYIGIKKAKKPIEEVYSWDEHLINFRPVGEKDVLFVDYEEGNPKINADMLLEILQSQIGYMSSVLPDDVIFALKYMDPLHYLFHSLENLIEIDILPKKCKNCGKYFIPVKRSDTIYCNRQAPQDLGVTCKTYGARQSWEKTLRENEVTRLYRKIYMQKQMAAKRNPDIETYKNDFENFKIQSKQWKRDVKNGTKAENEFLAWLKSSRRKDDD